MKLSKNQYLRYLLINSLLITQTAGFFPWEYVLNNNQGIEEYKKQNFVKAETLFNKALSDNPEDINIRFNLADTLYKKKNYIESQSIYLEILKNKNSSGELKQKAHYNLGNVLYRLGEQSNSELFWTNAVQEYQRALNIISDDKQARENYEFVKKKLKQIQPPPQNNQSEQSKDKQKRQNSQSQPQQVYTNQPPSSQPQNDQNFSVSPAEAENLLKELKDQEENMQNYVNKRQDSFEKKQKSPNIDNLKKDW